MEDAPLPRYPLPSDEPGRGDINWRLLLLRLLRFGLVAGVILICLFGIAIGLTSGFVFWFFSGD
jgi:hypothetical protein